MSVGVVHQLIAGLPGKPDHALTIAASGIRTCSGATSAALSMADCMALGPPRQLSSCMLPGPMVRQPAMAT